MRTVTFYSYKGGVGRSLTLANMASRLAEFGKKVCMLDFDLEAPGLHLKFQGDIKQPIEKGLVDYIHSYATEGKLPGKIAPYSIPLTLHGNKNVHLIPAGNIESNTYWKNLSSIDWYNLVYENPNSISFFLDLKQKIKKELNPDFLLIDSRTGISEMSGITISLLADEVVIVSANNQENLLGCKRIIDFLVNNEKPLLGKKQSFCFVLSRIPFPETPMDKGREQRLIATVKAGLPTVNPEHFFVLHSDRDLELAEKRKIGYDIDDDNPRQEVLQITREYLVLFEHLTDGILTPEEKVKFADIKKSKKLLGMAMSMPTSDAKLELLNTALELNHENNAIKLALAKVNIDLGKVDAGLKMYENILQQKQNQSIDIYEELGGAYQKVKRYGDAESIYNKMLKLFPQEKDVAYDRLGGIMQDTGRYEKAIEFYNLEILETNSEYGFNSRANTFRYMGNYDAALSDAFKALEINPDFAVAYMTLAEIYLSKGKMNEFYLNLEMGLNKDGKFVAENLSKEKIYAQVINEPRFKNLLEKYDVPMPVYEA